MSIYHPTIRINEKTNYDFELIVSHFEPDNGQTELYLGLEPIFTDNFDGTHSNDHGARYTQKASPVVTLTEADGSDIPPWKIRNVLRWLTGQKHVSWMDLLNQDGECVCSYLGRFISVQAYKLDGRVVGLVCQFQATSPWAYSAEKEYLFFVNDRSSFSLDNDSDDLYTYIYPKVTYYNRGTALTLQNTKTDRTTQLNNLSNEELVTMDNNMVIYSDNTAKLFKNDFNYIFPELVPGTNFFKATGQGALRFTFRYPMKVGDGLLDNYDMYNGIVLNVQSGILKIKGDTTQNPPTHVNISVDGNKIIVRGKLASVNIHTPTLTDVNNGHLAIEDSGKDCPFDTLNMRVTNGEFIINYDIPRVEIPKDGVGD